MKKLATLYKHIELLQKRYLKYRPDEAALLNFREAEIAEGIFNSNAIENSTLTLADTESILFHSELPRNLNLNDVMDAKQLSELTRFLAKTQTKFDEQLLLDAHRIFFGPHRQDIAGRFRKKGEHVRVAGHMAPLSEKIPQLLEDALLEYHASNKSNIIERIAKFHIEFEMIHPFYDGNGRVGRALINYQLEQNYLPPIVIRNKEKKNYYAVFKEYKTLKRTNRMCEIIAKGVCESLHRRLCYFEGNKIQTLADWIKTHKLSPQATLNAAKRQSLAAFRERGVWKISSAEKPD